MTTVVIRTISLLSVLSLVMRKSARRLGKLELRHGNLRKTKVVEAVEAVEVVQAVVLVLMGNEVLGTVLQRATTLA